MGDRIEQYRGAVGSHFVFLKYMEYKKCFKADFGVQWFCFFIWELFTCQF